jgi:hypothetical protein
MIPDMAIRAHLEFILSTVPERMERGEALARLTQVEPNMPRRFREPPRPFDLPPPIGP